MARKSTGKSTARTRRLARASSPPAAPPPARLLGNLVGQHAPQLPPGPPAVITGPKTLLKVWAYNDEAPNVTTIPRTELWLELYDHKEALESVFLHPKMKIERYDHKSKEWVPVGWKESIVLKKSGGILLLRRDTLYVVNTQENRGGALFTSARKKLVVGVPDSLNNPGANRGRGRERNHVTANGSLPPLRPPPLDASSSPGASFARRVSSPLLSPPLPPPSSAPPSSIRPPLRRHDPPQPRNRGIPQTLKTRSGLHATVRPGYMSVLPDLSESARRGAPDASKHSARVGMDGAAVVAGNVVRDIYSFVASRSSYITSRRPHAEIWLQRAVVAEGAVPLYMVKAYSKRNFLPKRQKWKQTKVKEILALPLFVGKLPSREDDKTNGATPAEWAENRKQKLKTAVANTTSTSGSTQSTTAKSSGSPSLPSTRTHYLGHPTFSASKLFEIENKEAILEEACAAAGIAGVSRPFAFYQPSKKKLWAAVSVKEQEIYHERALKRQNDVDAHQLAFGNGIWDDVQNFVKSGSYGDCTMTLLYGFRDPRGKLLRSVASAHFRDGDFFEETEGGSQLFERWKEYLESALPVFQEHCRPQQAFSWKEAAEQYDKTRFPVPVSLEQFETLDFKEIPIVADYFVKTQDDDAFIFNAETGGSKDDGSAANDVHESNDDVAKPKPKKKQAKKDKGKKAAETPKDDVPEPPEGGKSGNSGGDKAIELEDDVPKSPAHGNSGNSGGDKAIEDKHDAPEPPEGGKSGNSGGGAVHAPKGRGRTAEKPKAADTQGGNKARGAKRPRVDKRRSNAKKRRVATQEPEGIAASRPKRASKVPLRFGETSVAAAAKPAKSAPKPRGWKGYALVSESIKSNRPNDADIPCDTLESLDILPGRSAPFGVVGVVAGMVATMSVVQLPGHSRPLGVVGVGAGDGGDGSYEDVPLDTSKSVVQLPGHSRRLGVVGVGAGDGGDGSYQDVPLDTSKSVVQLPGPSRPLGVVGVGAGDGGDGSYEDVPLDTSKSVVQLPGHSRRLGVVGVGAGDGGDGSYQDVPLDTSKSVVQLPGPSRPLGVVGVGAGDGGDGIYKNAPWDTFKTVVLLPGHSGPLGVVGVGAGDGGDGSYQDVPLDTSKSVVQLPGHSRRLGVVGVGAGDGGDGIYKDVPWDTFKSVVLLPGHSRPLGVVGVGAGDGGMVSTKPLNPLNPAGPPTESPDGFIGRIQWSRWLREELGVLLAPPQIEVPDSEVRPDFEDVVSIHTEERRKRKTRRDSQLVDPVGLLPAVLRDEAKSDQARSRMRREDTAQDSG
ncbi:hypothetical protein B0H11DRAFT_1928519 [Mycena galericulata]|nr:hypothetical protein B0H11DRAFT_1928519 [Mycena galericulata]